MVIVFSYKGVESSEKLREDVIDRYNKIRQTSTYVRLFFDDGVPYLDGDGDISITHTTASDGERIELIAISDGPIGIDIESKSRKVNLEIARRYFSPDENEYVGDNVHRFMEIWQKKEAYGKRLKVGLYRQSVMELKHFVTYEIYEGYNVVIYSRDTNIVFVTI